MARRGKVAGKQRASIRDKARQAAESKERSSGGLDTLKDLPDKIEFFKPKMGKGVKGENFFSIIPYEVSIDNHPFQTPGELWHECTYWRHTVGEGQDRKSFICLASTTQSTEKRCPICEYRAALIKSGNDPDLADQLKPKQRQIFNILDHDDEDKGIQIFEMSPHMFGFMLDDEEVVQSERNFDGKFYADVQDGLSIIARFDQGSFAGNKFPEIARIDFEERDDLPDELIDEAVDFDACLRILTYDELYKKFHGFIGEEDDEQEEEKPSRPSRSSRTKEEGEPEEKPKGRERTRRTKAEDKEKEPEPEEKPKRLRRKPEPDPEPEEDEQGPDDDNGCPHGLMFGTDCDTDELCDDCDVWEACKDEQEALEAEGKKGKKK
jgi:hypothetical protein